MNRTLIIKTFRDYGLLLLGAAGLLILFVVLYMFAASSLSQARHLEYLQIPWIRRLISAMIGADVVGTFTPTSLVCFAFSHPMMWTILVSFTFTVTSGVLAGETDRGTMDVLAGLPISRSRIYTSLTAVVMSMGLVLCGAIWVGAWLGSRILHNHEIDLSSLALVGCHLFGVYACIACIGLAVSGACDRRGPALVICFLIVFYAFLLNLLTVFWPPAAKIAWTGLLHYYKPLPIVSDGGIRWGDFTVLWGAAVVAWTAGWWGFRNRDIHGP